MDIKRDNELMKTLRFATINKNIIEPKTANQLVLYINQLEKSLVEMSKALVRIDNASLEESGYSFSCDTHDHDNCVNCDVLKAKQHIKSMEVN